MKYLKILKDWESFRFPIYEEYKDELFWKITPEEYTTRIYGESYGNGFNIKYILSQWENFSESEKSNISKISTSVTGYSSIKENSPDRLEIIFHVPAGIPVRSQSYIISKLKDEWYYVGHERSYKQLYKCDQFDGLIECLKYLKEGGSR